MANTPVILDQWRAYFTAANCEIFNIIEHAIMVAAFDFPDNFKVQRDKIVEVLFTCTMIKCSGCHGIKLAAPIVENMAAANDDDDNNYKVNQGCCNNNYEDDESQLVEEILKLKEIVDNGEEEPDELLFDSLSRLKMMRMSVEILKETDVGKSVSTLRKHGSKEIRRLVETLIEDWRGVLDKWVRAAAAVAEVATETAKTSPLEEGAFLANPTSMQFVDGTDDNGNPRNSEGFNDNRNNGTKSIPKRNPSSHNDSSTHSKAAGNKTNQESIFKKEPSPCKPNGPRRSKPPSSEIGTGRPEPVVRQNIIVAIEAQPRSDTGKIKKKPILHHLEKLSCDDNEASVRVKLEAAKRKLQKRYEEAENAKKQRIVKFIDSHDLSKQRNQQKRPGNHSNNGSGER